MNKSFSLFALLFSMLSSFPGFGQLKLGMKAGISANNAVFYSTDEEADKRVRDITKPRPGFSAGLAAAYALSQELDLQTGILWMNKGYITKNEYQRLRHSFNYLEIPVHLAYKLGNFQIHGGPYAAIGQSGSMKIKTFNGSGSSSGEFKQKFKFQDRVSNKDIEDLEVDEAFRRRLDLGLSLGVGYRSGPFLMTATYSHGTSDHKPEYEEDRYNFNNITTHQGIRLEATWYFRQQ